jgi:hypothetical protein
VRTLLWWQDLPRALVFVLSNQEYQYHFAHKILWHSRVKVLIHHPVTFELVTL